MKRTQTPEAASYGFANELWVTKLFGNNTGRAHIKIACFAVTPLLIGAAVAITTGFLAQFVANVAIYYGAFGVYLTTAAVWSGSRRQYEIYDRFLDCFDITAQERNALLHETLASYSNTKEQVLCARNVFLVALCVTLIGFWAPEINQAIGNRLSELFRFEDFARAGWYDGRVRGPAVIVTLTLALFASVPLGTAYRLMLQMPRLLFRCARKGSVLFPRLIKVHFAPLTSFYTRISLLWSVGIALFIVLFRGNSNWIFLGATAGLFLLGLLNFIVPQIVYAKTTSGAEEYWLDRAGVELGQFAQPSVEAEATHVNATTATVLGVDSYFLTHDAWVYPIHETYGVAAAQLASLAGIQAWTSLKLLGNVANH